MELRGKLVVKAGNGKGFKVEGNENWFNATDAVVPFLAKMNKGEVVVVTYEKKGVKQEATKIMKATTTTTAPAASSTVTSAANTTTAAKTYQKSYTSEYNSAERQAAIQRGNALNAAAALLAGRPEDPDALAEMVLVQSQKFLEWLRAE